MPDTKPIGPPRQAVTDGSGYQLRPYQRDAIDSVEKAFAAGKRRVAVVIPTGGGKTVVFSHLIRRLPLGSRVLVLAHRSELVDQAADKIAAVAPHLSVGVVRNIENEHGADVVVAMVQTISNSRRLQQIDPHRFDLIIVDEAHHATARTYRTVLDYFRRARALGVSATLARADGDALGDIWEEVVYRVDILNLIDHTPPYLCDVRGRRVVADGLDLSTVRSGADGDYRLGELEDQMTEAGAWAATADAYVQHADDRVGVVFTPTVASAHTVAELLVARGLAAEAVDGTTPKDERDAILARFATGETRVVANCGVLTEGFDNPAISCVAIARPTRSRGLYVQMAGRGLRLHPGKQDCLILDLVGAAEDKQLATLADLTGHDVTEVHEGETLREAKDRADTTLASNTVTPYLGPLTDYEINLFGTSQVAWTTWRGDVHYIDVPKYEGGVTVYIAPGDQPGTYDAIARRRRDGAEKVIAAGSAFASAMRQAEAQATAWGGALTARGSWRDQPATDKQRWLLARRGIPASPGLTKGQVTRLLTDADIDRDFTARAPRGYHQEAA